MPRYFEKDPDAVLDYRFDWEDWLAGDVISTATITISPSGELAADSVETGTSDVTVWLSGGVANTKYEVTCHIETTNSPAREDDRRIWIRVKER